jgi:hypothetical protein
MIVEANPQKANGRISRQLDCAAISAELLSDEERRELRESEETIRRGAGAWLATGLALIAIRDKRLHRETHSTLEAYCWEKFHLDKSTVYGHMRAAKRHQLVTPIATKLGIQITAESQMRPLCVCQAVELPKVLKLAASKTEPDKAGNRFPTAKILAEAVQEVRGGNASPGNASPASKRNTGEIPTPANIVSSIPAYPDSVLLTLARAIATELANRGLISLPGKTSPN